MLDRLFKLKENNTTVKTEVLAGITTFLTMAYIIFVNPAMLAETGMDKGAVFVATCLAAAIGSALMGGLANYPIALAPGMGLNAYFTYGVVLGMGYPWQVALGAVFLSGFLFIILSVLPIRSWLINAVPQSLKIAISAGIGLFLGLIALENAGLVVDNPATLVSLGNLSKPEVLLSALGFITIVVLSVRKVPGAILIVVIALTAIGAVSGLNPFHGLASMPPSLAPTFLALDLKGVLDIGLVTIVFAFLFVDLFDTAGTLIGLAHRAGMLDAQGRLPRLKKALLADSIATVAGATCGTSTTTSYIESAAGMNAGGRTGLTAMVVAVLFIACLFFSPLAGSVPTFATAPALLYVACLMARGLSEINWDDMTDAAPSVITALAMPFTFSISTGIGLGFISYAAIKVLSGKTKELNAAVVVICLIFLIKFAIM